MRPLRTSELEEMEDEWKTAQKKDNRSITDIILGVTVDGQSGGWCPECLVMPDVLALC